jgi:hypothetical protein
MLNPIGDIESAINNTQKVVIETTNHFFLKKGKGCFKYSRAKSKTKK